MVEYFLSFITCDCEDAMNRIAKHKNESHLLSVMCSNEEKLNMFIA